MGSSLTGCGHLSPSFRPLASQTIPGPAKPSRLMMSVPSGTPLRCIVTVALREVGASQDERPAGVDGLIRHEAGRRPGHEPVPSRALDVRRVAHHQLGFSRAPLVGRRHGPRPHGDVLRVQHRAPMPDEPVSLPPSLISLPLSLTSWSIAAGPVLPTCQVRQGGAVMAQLRPALPVRGRKMVELRVMPFRALMIRAVACASAVVLVVERDIGRDTGHGPEVVDPRPRGFEKVRGHRAGITSGDVPGPVDRDPFGGLVDAVEELAHVLAIGQVHRERPGRGGCSRRRRDADDQRRANDDHQRATQRATKAGSVRHALARRPAAARPPAVGP